MGSVQSIDADEANTDIKELLEQISANNQVDNASTGVTQTQLVNNAKLLNQFLLANNEQLSSDLLSQRTYDLGNKGILKNLYDSEVNQSITLNGLSSRERLGLSGVSLSDRMGGRNYNVAAQNTILEANDELHRSEAEKRRDAYDFALADQAARLNQDLQTERLDKEYKLRAEDQAQKRRIIENILGNQSQHIEKKAGESFTRQYMPSYRNVEGAGFDRTHTRDPSGKGRLEARKTGERVGRVLAAAQAEKDYDTLEQKSKEGLSLAARTAQTLNTGQVSNKYDDKLSLLLNPNSLGNLIQSRSELTGADAGKYYNRVTPLNSAGLTPITGFQSASKDLLQSDKDRASRQAKLTTQLINDSTDLHKLAAYQRTFGAYAKGVSRSTDEDNTSRRQ